MPKWVYMKLLCNSQKHWDNTSSIIMSLQVFKLLICSFLGYLKLEVQDDQIIL